MAHCGTPVITFGKGGACETVIDDAQPQPTGMFCEEQSVEPMQAAFRRIEAGTRKYLSESCRAGAERFSEAAFRRGFLAVVLKVMESHRNSRVWRKLRASIRPPVRAIAVEDEPAQPGVTSLRS